MSPRNTDNITNRTDARNRGLRRVRHTTGLFTAASAAGVAVLAGGYAHALPGTTGTVASVAKPTQTAPGHAAPTSPRTSTSTSPTQTQQTTQAKAPAASSAPTLQAPVQAPTTSANNAPSQVTSGGS